MIALSLTLLLALFAFFVSNVSSFQLQPSSSNHRFVNPCVNSRSKSVLSMKVENDAFRKANRSMRQAGADERTVELLLPMGMDLDEDKDGNVYVKSIEKGGRAEKSGKVFVGDIIAMASATFGDEMWSCRGVGLGRVTSTIKVRNTKPVKLVLEAPNEQEEKRRRSIAYAEKSEAEKKEIKIKEEELMKAMQEDDEQLLKKRKGLFGLW